MFRDWFTAPLAWLYAIPLERFLSPGEATRGNLCLLGIVALWRVLLMIRVVNVLFGASLRASTFVVMFFADTVALAILFLTPLPVFRVMGGIRLSESESAVQTAAFSIGFFGGISWLVWMIGFFATLCLSKPEWVDGLANATSAPIRPSLKFLAGLSVAGWLLVLPMTQAEQLRRWKAERLLLAGRTDEAVAFMSSRERDAFPPHWEIPPRIGYGESQPSMIDVIESVLEDGTAPWVREVFVPKFRDFLREYVAGFQPHVSENNSRRVAGILQQLSRDELTDLADDWMFQDSALQFLASDPVPELSDVLRPLFPHDYAREYTPGAGVSPNSDETTSPQDANDER